jgi:hypothetical protein
MVGVAHQRSHVQVRSRWHQPLFQPLDGWLLIGALVVWLSLQAAHWGSFLYHDAWRHNFPRFFSISRLGDCTGLPTWNGTVDSGWPVIIEVISSGLTNYVRLPFLYLTGCWGLDVVPALYLYKVQILVMWLVVALGTYVLGRTLFRHRLSAALLFAAVLFAGVGLDDLHSDQDGWILGWLPWIVTCAVQAHRHRASPRGALYFNATVLLLCIQALDHYPHFPLVVALAGSALYALLFPGMCWEFIRRQWLRVWPAAILVLVTGVQLLIFRDAISSYIPSQRTDLIIDLSQNGESGWLQPSFVLSSLLPLTTLAGFDYFAGSMRDWLAANGGPNQTMFIFRPNSLIYYVGFIPLVLCAAFAFGPHARRIKMWWFGMTAIILAISIQETQISYWMFNLPFFNVLRTYSLFGLFVAMFILIISGYGLDTVLDAEPIARQRLVRRSLVVLGVATLLAALSETALALWRVPPLAVSQEILEGFAADAIVVVAGGVVLWYASRSVSMRRWLPVLGVVVLSQTVFAEGVYHWLGMPISSVLNNYRLDVDDTTSSSSLDHQDPNSFFRKPCDSFAVCYLSRREAVSLRHDDQATFLRNAHEPVFQDGLSDGVVRALDGINHPVFWLSATVAAYSDTPTLVTTFNAHARDIGAYLNQVTFVQPSDLSRALSVGPANTDDAGAHLDSMDRGRDVVRLTYTSRSPVYLNAAINYDPSWNASVNGHAIQPILGNFNDLLVPLPAAPQGGTVVLTYRSVSSDFFFLSRYAMILLGVGVLLVLAWQVCRGGSWVRLATTPLHRECSDASPRRLSPAPGGAAAG